MCYVYTHIYIYIYINIYIYLYLFVFCCFVFVFLFVRNACAMRRTRASIRSSRQRKHQKIRPKTPSKMERLGRTQVTRAMMSARTNKTSITQSAPSNKWPHTDWWRENWERWVHSRTTGKLSGKIPTNPLPTAGLLRARHQAAHQPGDLPD